MSLEVPETKNWTDDLPVCSYTGKPRFSLISHHASIVKNCHPIIHIIITIGVGLSTNQLYKEDGHRREAHEFEDRSFHFKIDDKTFLYGVFNGVDGSCVSDFAAQRLPAEILLGQLNDTTSPAEVKDVLREAFLAVERSYFESIDDLLAERANLLCELPEGIFNAFYSNQICNFIYKFFMN